MLRGHFLRLLYPRGVFPRIYAGRLLPDEVVGSVVVFFSLYFVCYALLTIALMALDLDFADQRQGGGDRAVQCRPRPRRVIGPAGNFAPLPDTAKWLLCFAHAARPAGAVHGAGAVHAALLARIEQICPCSGTSLSQERHGRACWPN